MTITNSNAFKLNVTTSTWTPPYPVPQNDGDVTIIGGLSNPATYNAIGGPIPQGSPLYVSDYPTENTERSTEPPEQSGVYQPFAESFPAVITSWGLGGAACTAGTGGHSAQGHLGAWIFDFNDAKHKRIWTTNGNPGVDNITDTQVAGTKVHNIPQLAKGNFRDVYDKYSFTGAKWWIPSGWTPNGFQLSIMPLAPNAWEQTWEVTQEEPYPYNPTVTTDQYGQVTSGPDGWPYPGQWAGLQGCAFAGLIGRSAPGSVRPLDPQPWPSTIPLPAHIWECSFELLPSEGGGPKGTFVCGRHAAAGPFGNMSCAYIHGFDLHTGTWSQVATNKVYHPSNTHPEPFASVTTPTTGVMDPVYRRFFVPSQHGSSGIGGKSLNYFSLAQKRWYGVQTSTPLQNVGRTETIACDHVRRVLLLHTGTGYTKTPTEAIKVLDISSHGPTDPLPVMTNGWLSPPVIQSLPYLLDGRHDAKWVYYPPNGKFYRYKGATMHGDPQTWNPPGNWLPPWHLSLPVTNGTDPVRDYGGWFDFLERLTPPAIVAQTPPGYNSLGHYYTTAPWTFDRITLNRPCLNATRLSTWERYPKRLLYIPSIQRLAWIPLDNFSGEPVQRLPVYLIKPY
jgi:hypothetical protein